MIYLDNAATTGKKPEIVIKSVNNALRTMSANPGRGGHTLSNRASEAVFAARQKVAKMFDADDDRIIFTPNCTTALNIAIKGVINSGQGIVISSLEHNAVTRPTVTVNKKGCPVKVAEVIFGDADATLRSFERAIDKNTAVVVCTHASNVSGEILPIEKIGALCKDRGITFIVDAAQTAGVLPISTKKMNIDFLCIAPHKGLYAPMGTGILIANSEIRYPLIEGGTGVNSYSLEQPSDYPERLESGTVNLPGIVGISAGIDFVNSKGTGQIYLSELALIERLYNGLSKISGVILYTPKPQKNKYVPLLSFNLRSMPSDMVAEKLSLMGFAVRAGLHCAPLAHKRMGTIDGGTVRVSTGVFNNINEIDAFIRAVSKIKK